MSDPTGQPPLLPPPGRRPAPEHLRLRISGELARAGRRARAPRLVLALVAAVTLIVAGTFGVTRFAAQHIALPVATPGPSSAEPTPSSSELPLATASPSPSELRYEREVRSMTTSETSDDLDSCTKDTQGIDHRGTYRAGVAVHAPVITVPADNRTKDSRILYASDDAGTFTCVDGANSQWGATGSGDARTPSDTYPAASLDGFTDRQSCSTAARDGHLEEAELWRVKSTIERAELTVRSAGQPVQVVVLRPSDGIVAAWFRLSGASAWADTHWSIRFLDADGDAVKIDTARNAGTPAPTTQTRAIDSCTRIMKIRNLGHVPEARPTSDAAGVTACRKEITMAADNQQQPFEAANVDVSLTISSDQAWGTILRDGDHYAACSRFPTQEVGAIRSTGQDLSAKAFYWATNPMNETGETLWAAGQLDGVESITYQLPDGQRVPAEIAAGGYWMVMARTATSFDTEDNVSNWSPVVVTARVGGVDHRYRIKWTATTMCNQVSHGC